MFPISARISREPRAKPALAYALLATAILAATWLLTEPSLRRSAESDIRLRLSFQTANRSDLLERRKAKLRDDALFLSRVPPVQGLVRAIEGRGVDRLENTPESNWRNRLERIFAAFAETNPEISQIRFIGVADGGREIVRIDRHGDSVAVVPRDKLLRKGDRRHFQRALSLPTGEVFVSDIEIKSEAGWDSIPILRGGTPVRDGRGNAFGVVVVNIDARPMLREFRSELPPPFQPLLLDGESRFICHPDPRREFLSPPGGTPARWRDLYASDPPDGTVAHWIRSVGAPAGSLLVASRRIGLDGFPSHRSWTVLVAYPDSALARRIHQSLWPVLEMEAAALILAGLILHLALVGAQRRVAFANERARLGAIVDGSSDAIISKDAYGPIVSWNRAAESMFGIPADQAVGKMTLREILFPNGGGEILTQLRLRLLEGDASPSATIEWTGQRGRRILFVALSPVRSQAGTISGFAVTIRDITEQEDARARIEELNSGLESQVRDRTAELEKKTEEAMAAGRAKAEFLANMSHEIRTPMTAVMGLAQLLENRTREAETREVVRKIRRAGASLQSLIDDILDFSKIEAGRLELERVEFSMDEVLDNLATIMSNTAGSKEIDLAIGAPPPGTTRLVGDPHRLGQVLVNLTGNAIKFTEKGSVTVAIEKVSRGGGNVVLRFSVKDTGIGIPAEKIPALFSAFTQADASTTRRFGGSGLGLAISRLLVEKMGGRIEVESEPGKGSVFRFDAAFEVARIDLPASGPDFDVLVADDAEESRKSIASVVESLGWHPTEVEDGEKALRATLDRDAKGAPYDIVLLDWKMPGMDGLRTARELRSSLDARTPPIVILATAHSREEISATREAHLADEILAKPVTGSALYDAVARVLRSRGSGNRLPTETATGRTRQLDGLRYLVVDDSEANRDLLQAVLSDEGADVSLAEDGEAALRWLRSHGGEVDAVLMDVQMPGMDGYAATRELRSDPAFRDLPVVALSAGVFPSERQAAIDAGMDGFIPKPFLVEELVGSLARLSRPAGSIRPAASVAGMETDSVKIVDSRRGISLWKSEEAYDARLARFADGNAGFADAVAALLESGSTDAACGELHRFRGVAGALALPALVEACRDLETAIRSPGGDRSTGRLRSELQAALREIGLRRAPSRGARTGIPAAATTAELPGSIGELRRALATDSRKAALEAMDKVGQLPAARWEEFRALVQGYEFRAAERVLDDIEKELDPTGAGT